MEPEFFPGIRAFAYRVKLLMPEIYQMKKMSILIYFLDKTYITFRHEIVHTFRSIRNSHLFKFCVKYFNYGSTFGKSFMIKLL